MDLKAQGLAWLLALFATSAFAQSPSEVRKQVEASMLVTGHVLIEPDGSVSGWEIDQREKLPPAVAELVENSAPAWRFEPVVVDGVQRKAKARMSLRVMVSQLEERDAYRLSIVGGYFGGDAITPAERQEQKDSLSALELKPPVYPMQALRMGARGTAYVVVKVGRGGKVADAYVEQVNLKVVGSEYEMRRMRNILSSSALQATKKWSFRAPLEGEQADDDFWYARVPVEYAFHGDEAPGYGEWESYVPGPRQDAPWKSLEDLDGFDGSPDVLVAGEVYEIGKGRKLLTPLDGG